MTAAAFKACYSDFKLVKTRGVVQLIFEVPLHDSAHALEAVGGMPDTAAERWFAIARLVEGPRPLERFAGDDIASDRVEIPLSGGTCNAGTGSAGVAGSNPARSTKKSWADMPPSQQAGVLCADKSFQKFLTKVRGDGEKVRCEEDAACVIRNECLIDTRARLDIDAGAAQKWRQIVSDYRAWMREPEVIG